MRLTRRVSPDWDEQDVHTGWRHVMCRYKRAGAAKKVKRLTNRRERREGQRDTRRQERGADR